MVLTENYSDIDENEVIRRIQNGDSQLFAVISNRYISLINFFVSSLGCSESDREDLVQEGLLALYSAVGVFDFASASFNTFASVCIKRGLISALRRISLKKRLPQDMFDNFNNIKNDDFGPEEALINKESFTHFLDKVKLSLSSFEYSVFSAYLKYGNYLEVAEHLSVPIKKVDNALQRVRKKISKINR